MNKKTAVEVLNDISSTIDVQLEYYLKQSFFKDYRKIHVNGEDVPLPDAGDETVSKEKFDELLAPFIKEKISFVNYLTREMKDFLAHSFLVQMTLIYNKANDEDIQEMHLDSYTGEEDETHRINAVYKDYCTLIENSVVKPKSKTSQWRLKKDFEEFYTICRNCPYDKFDEELQEKKFEYHMSLYASHPNSSLEEDYYKGFDIERFIWPKTIFRYLSLDSDTDPVLMPSFFCAYLGFVIQFLLKKRQLFVHCETYKENWKMGNTNNIGREMDNVQRHYNQYIDVTNTILQKLQESPVNIDTEINCADFMLNETFLHHRFFSSLDCDLFHYIAEHINFGFLKEELTTAETDEFYTLLKLLWFFNISLDDLSDCAFESEDCFICGNLGQITSQDNPLRIPFDFIRDYLKEVFFNLGDIIKDCNLSFYKSFTGLSDVDPELFYEGLHELTTYINNNYEEATGLFSSNQRTVTILDNILFTDKHPKDELLLIVHLLHLAGTEPHFI